MSAPKSLTPVDLLGVANNQATVTGTSAGPDFQWPGGYFQFATEATTTHGTAAIKMKNPDTGNYLDIGGGLSRTANGISGGTIAEGTYRLEYTGSSGLTARASGIGVHNKP